MKNYLSQESALILQTIKTEGDFSENIVKSFQTPKYLKVNKTLINSIPKILKYQNNQILNFDSPPSLTLHFIEKK